MSKFKFAKLVGNCEVKSRPIGFHIGSVEHGIRNGIREKNIQYIYEKQICFGAKIAACAIAARTKS